MTLIFIDQDRKLLEVLNSRYLKKGRNYKRPRMEAGRPVVVKLLRNGWTYSEDN